jgi:hypothetical protein
MNPESSKLRQQQQEAEQAAALEHQVTAAKEFNTTEEMMRFDAANTTVPERVAERLKQSIAAEPLPTKPWWQRLFGK